MFLSFSFNGQTNAITGIDTSTQFPGNKDTYYFLTNNLDPNGNRVGISNTTFNLFRFTQSTDTRTFLASANSIRVTAVPEPNSPLADTLTFGALGAGYLLKNKLKKQKINKALST